MRRGLRYLAIVVVLFLCGAGGMSWWAYEAVQDVRPFYREAMAVQPSVLREAGQELNSRAAALVNEVQRDEPWQAHFTEDQLNGWLAFDLPEKHAHLIPHDIADPRVSIEDQQLKLGVRYMGERIKTVLSVDVEPYLAEPNVVGLRILSANAGTLPVPLGEVTERMTRAAVRFGIPLTWIQESETPTALVTLRVKSRRSGRSLQLDALEVGPGAIMLRGISKCEPPEAECTSEATCDEQDATLPASKNEPTQNPPDELAAGH
jgi:hypothetical protein